MSGRSKHWEIKTIFFAGIILILILAYITSATATVEVAIGVNVNDIYGSPIENLNLTIYNGNLTSYCATGENGYCILNSNNMICCDPSCNFVQDVGNFSINFTYCGNVYNFNVSFNNCSEGNKNLTLNVSANCNIPETCSIESDCADNRVCYNGFCKDLTCNAGYRAQNHNCELIVGCKIGAKISAKVGAKNTNYSNVIEISNCTRLNVSNSIYFLTQDIAFSGDTCINITSENVSLDCRWNLIKGNGSYGIFVNAKNAFIENCIVENWDTGIHLNLSNNTAYCNLIENNSRGITSNAKNELYKNLGTTSETIPHPFLPLTAYSGVTNTGIENWRNGFNVSAEYPVVKTDFGTFKAGLTGSFLESELMENKVFETYFSNGTDKIDYDKNVKQGEKTKKNISFYGPSVSFDLGDWSFNAKALFSDYEPLYSAGVSYKIIK